MSTRPAYSPASDLLPLSDAELELLDELLAELPEAMNVEALDGYLSALLLAPQPLARLPGEAWLPPIWGQAEGEPDPFASGKQRKKLQLLVLRHARALDTQLRSPAWQPLFGVFEQDGQLHVSLRHADLFVRRLDGAHEIVESHLERGQVVERLLLAPDVGR